jgi:pantoate--beta-alanine ligase
LSRALFAARHAAEVGADALEARAAALKVFADQPGIEVDYCVVVDPDTISDAGDRFTGEALVLVAARVGGTRLIDNMRIVLGPAHV